MELVTSTRIDDVLARLKGKFVEMPGSELTVDQACQLTEVDVATCLALLLALEQGRFLQRTRAGRFLLQR